MRRTIWLLAGVLLCVVALGSDSPKEYDDKMEVASTRIDGIWREIECHSTNMRIRLLCGSVITLRDGTYTTKYDDDKCDPGLMTKGTFRIDTSRKPFCLDYRPPGFWFVDHPLKFIYEIKGDTLRIARSSSHNILEERRPQGFNDDGIVVETYKRVK